MNNAIMNGEFVFWFMGALFIGVLVLIAVESAVLEGLKWRGRRDDTQDAVKKVEKHPYQSKATPYKMEARRYKSFEEMPNENYAEFRERVLRSMDDRGNGPSDGDKAG